MGMLYELLQGTLLSLLVSSMANVPKQPSGSITLLSGRAGPFMELSCMLGSPTKVCCKSQVMFIVIPVVVLLFNDLIIPRTLSL